MAQRTTLPDPLDIALGANIRRRRKALGLSQSALAEASGVSFQQVQKYERGSNRVSFSRLVQFARTLNCGVVDLMADIDEGSAAVPLTRQSDDHLRLEGARELLAAYAAVYPPLRASVLKLLVGVARSAPRETLEQ